MPTASLPGLGTASNVERTRIAAGRKGVLFVSVPRRAGAMLAALGPDGRPLPGWPIEVPSSTACSALLPADDGSVRVLCDGTDLPKFEWCCDPWRAFAFGPDARPLAGWPVQVPMSGGAAVVGTDLVVLTDHPTTDTPSADKPSHRASILRIASDGTVREGKAVDLLERCCLGWAIGPDGAAYGRSFGDWDFGPTDPPERTTIEALDERGLRDVGPWPASLRGIASSPGFAVDGHLLFEIGSADSAGAAVRALDAASGEPAGASAVLPMHVVELGAVDCGGAEPEPPIVDAAGRVFLFSTIDARIHGLDPSLATRDGWPIRMPSALEAPGFSRGGLDCFPPVRPVPDERGGVVLVLAARNERVGGSIIAIDEDGVRAGWPVELRRPGAQFWSVTVGDDGTAYALAVEPEGSRRWSATILAIEPDSSVRYRATLLEP